MGRLLFVVALIAFAAAAPGAWCARRLLQSSQEIMWFEPSNGRLNDVVVPVGGSVRFVWTGTHDLWEIASLACPATFTNGTNIQQLAPQSRGGSRTVQFSSAGVRYFACSVGDHCEDGQLIAVNAGGSPAPAPGPRSRYRGGSSSNYGPSGEPIAEYGGSEYGEEEEGGGYGDGAPSGSSGSSGSGSSYGSSYGSGR